MAKGIYVGVSEDSLITNGDFSNGLEGWTADSKLSAEVINENGENVLKITNITNSSVVAWVNVTQEFNPISGHKYYISAYTKGASNNTAGSYGLYVLAFDICATPQVGITTDTWTFVSAIDSEADSQASFGTSIRLRIPIGATDNVSYFKNIKVYDLTEMFGTGNEPTQQWCDNNLTTLENLYKSKNSKSRKVKKAYVGVKVTGNNLIVNGDFSNGVSGWYYDDVNSYGALELSANDNVLTINLVKSNTSNNIIKSETNINTVAGHVYYAKLEAKSNSSNDFRFYATLAGSPNISTNDLVKDNEWHILSLRGVTGEYSYPFMISCYQPDKNNTVECRNIAVYDLTAMFGTGNEPTQEWCDNNLDAVIGKGIARKVKKGYIGVAGVAQLFYSSETLVPFTSNPAPTTWTEITANTDYEASNMYGVWYAKTIYAPTANQTAVSRAFDASTSTYWSATSTTNTAEREAQLWLPQGVSINPTKITIIHQYVGRSALQGKVQGSVDGTDWVDLCTLTVSTNKTTETFDITTETFYKYFRVLTYRYSSSYNTQYVYDFQITAGTLKTE